MADKNPSTSFKSLDRAFAIFTSFSFSKPQLTVAEISEITGIPKSTVHRFIKIFISQGFIKESQTPGFFTLGLKFLELGNIVHQNLDLRCCAQSAMESLSREYSITVHLVIRDREEGIYIDKVESEGQHIYYSYIGKRIPLHCTGAGKVLLSDLSDEAISDLFSFPLPSFTVNTIEEKEDLLREIHIAKDRGWAEDSQELELGLACIAVPVRDHRGKIVAAISSSALAISFDSDKKSKLIEGLQKTSMKISRQLGAI